MSYSSRRHIIHIDLYGVEHRLEFHQRDYTGASEGMLADGDASVATFDQARIDTRSPDGPRVLDASLDVHQLLQDNVDEQLLEDIFAADEDEFLLVWKKNGAEHWTGSLMNDLFEGREAPYPWTGVATAKDFSLLKGQDYEFSDDRKTVIEVIADLLGVLPYQLDIETATGWQHGSSTGNEDFLQRTWMDTVGLREYARTGDEQDERITHYEALEWICNNYLLYIKQEFGRWRVFQKSAYKDPENVWTTVYNPDGTQKTPGTNTNWLHDVGSDDFKILENGTQTRGVSAVRRARVKYEHRTEISSITLPEKVTLDNEGNGNESFIEFFISDGNQTIDLESSRVQGFFSNPQSGNGPNFRWTIRHGDNYWDESAAEWVTEPTENTTFMKATGREGTSRGGQTSNFLALGALFVSTAPVPSGSGLLEVRFRLATSSAGTAHRTVYNNPSIRINNPVAQENSTSIDYEIEQSNTRGLSTNVDLAQVYYGEGPAIYSRGALRYSDADNDFITSSWGLRGETQNLPFFENFLRDYLTGRWNHTKAISASTYGLTDSRRVENYRGKYFIYGGGVFDIRDGDWDTAELVEVSYVDSGLYTFQDFPRFFENNETEGYDFEVRSKENAVGELTVRQEGFRTSIPVELSVKVRKGSDYLIALDFEEEPIAITPTEDAGPGKLDLAIEEQLIVAPEGSYIVREPSQEEAEDIVIDQEIEKANADLNELDGELTQLNEVILPGLREDLEAAEAEVEKLNTVVLPGLQDDLDANSAELNTLNTVTLPGLQDDLDANSSELNTLNTVTLPGLQNDLDALEDELDGKFPISETDISDDAISTPKLQANVITAQKINALAITAAKIAAGAVEAEKIATNAITANKINAGAITTAKLAANAVEANNIAADAITANKIAAGAITTSKLAADAVEANNIAAGAIVANKIASGAVTTAKLQAGAVEAEQIASDAITTNKISAGAVTASKVTIGDLVALNANISGWSMGDRYIRATIPGTSGSHVHVTSELWSSHRTMGAGVFFSQSEISNGDIRCAHVGQLHVIDRVDASSDYGFEVIQRTGSGGNDVKHLVRMGGGDFFLTNANNDFMIAKDGIGFALDSSNFNDDFVNHKSLSWGSYEIDGYVSPNILGFNSVLSDRGLQILANVIILGSEDGNTSNGEVFISTNLTSIRSSSLELGSGLDTSPPAESNRVWKDSNGFLRIT